MATSAGGTTDGAIQSFTTLTPSAATTQAASSITTTNATLNASVNPQGSPTSVTFVYGTNPNLTSGTNTTTAQPIGGGASVLAVNAALIGLPPGTTYYDRVVATSAAGTIDGAIQSFTTLTPPAASTQAASSITTTNATLNASVNPQGSPTSVSFVDGTNPNLTSGTTTTTAQPIGGGASVLAVNAALIGLPPGTTYYDKVVATSAAGTIGPRDPDLHHPHPSRRRDPGGQQHHDHQRHAQRQRQSPGKCHVGHVRLRYQPDLTTGTTTTTAQPIGGGAAR